MKHLSLFTLMLAIGLPSSACLLVPADDSEAVEPSPPPAAPLPPVTPPGPTLVPTVEHCGQNAPQGLYVSGTLPESVPPNGTTIWIRAVGPGALHWPQTPTDIFLIAQATNGVFEAACPNGLFDNLAYPWSVFVVDANYNGACDEGDLFAYQHRYGWGMGFDEVYEINADHDPNDEHFDFGWSTFEEANPAFAGQPHLTGYAASICDIF
ncbi:MAG: hypothetical protein IPL79_11715 [Myxococcales bacterium]|nr:hypothetical protein [Myxococcales bacterium]